MNCSFILSSTKQAIITFFTLIALLFSPQIKSGPEYTPARPNELIMSFSLVSDIHVETTDATSYGIFVDLLKGMKGGKNTDAAVYLGDNVMNGQFFENLLFYSAVRKIMPAKTNLVALGNHDVGNGNESYDKLCSNFLKFNSLFLKNKIDKPYYYTVINGCYMIFLASEDSSPVISEEQILWLNGVLDMAAESNSPTFLFNHHPVFCYEEDDMNTLINLINKYDNLIYFCGHTHMELNEYSFEEYYGINTVYLPRSVGIEYESGVGIVVEVYEDQILVRPRNFISGEWIDELVYAFPLV